MEVLCASKINSAKTLLVHTFNAPKGLINPNHLMLRVGFSWFSMHPARGWYRLLARMLTLPYPFFIVLSDYLTDNERLGPYNIIGSRPSYSDCQSSFSREKEKIWTFLLHMQQKSTRSACKAFVYSKEVWKERKSKGL